MLLVVIAFGQWPDFVTAIVNPAAGRFFGRNVFAFVDRVYKQVGMTIEANLHEPAAQLGNEGKLHPFVRDLLRLPTLECYRMNLTRHRERRGKEQATGQSEGPHRYAACRRAWVSNCRRRWPIMISSPGRRVMETICSLSSCRCGLGEVCLRDSTSLGLSSVSTAIEGVPSSSSLAQSAVV